MPENQPKTKSQLFEENELLRRRVDEIEFTVRAINALTNTFFVFDPESGRPGRSNKVLTRV